MRVLVTGASGTLAPFVIRALWERHEVVLLSRRPPHAEFAALPWIHGDITVFDDCWRAVQDMDAMQHLAAQPWPVDHPRLREQAAAQGVPFDATFQSNMLGTYYLMQAAVAAGVERVVMAGSNCALGHGYRISQTPFPFQALPIDESHPAFPEDSYNYSKLAGELLLASTVPATDATSRAGDGLESLAVGLGGERGCGPCAPAPAGGADDPATTRCVLCHG